MPRRATILSLFAGAALLASPAAAAPQRPTNDALVLLETASATSALNQELRALQSELKSDPSNQTAAITLARTAIEAGRRAGDPRFYGEAEAALRYWWEKPDAPVEITILRATIRQSFHNFDAALADLDRVIEQQPDHLQARFSRAFIHMVTGDYASAAKDCAALANPRAALVRATCEARLGALTGKNGEAFHSLLLAAQRTRPNPLLSGFATVVPAEIAASLGDTATADRLYRGATSAEDADAATLAAYSDLLLASNRPREALELLEKRGQADVVLLRKAIAAKRTGDGRAAQWRDILEQRFAAAALSGNRVHLREEAMFRLDVTEDANAALPLAIENWKTQKEPADAAVLLKTAIAASDKTAADDVAAFLKARGVTDARLEPLLAKVTAP